jgi:hypothetical protein
MSTVWNGGKRLLFLAPLALLLGLLIAAPASASTTQVPIWQSNGSPTQLGTSVGVGGGEPIAGLTLEWHEGENYYWLSCESLSTFGAVENFAAGKAGTFSTSAAAFTGCWVSTPEFPNTCALSQAPSLRSATGELSDIKGSPTLNLTGTIVVDLTGCGKGTWTTNFSAALVPGWREGEFWLSKTVPVTPNSTATGELSSLGLMMTNRTTHLPVTVAQESFETGPFTGTHWFSGGAVRNRGEGSRTLLGAGQAVSLSKGSASVSFESTIAGINVKVACNGAGSVGGSVENPNGGGPGTAQLTLGFTGCEIVVPSGSSCSIVGGGFSTVALNGTQVEETGGPLLRLEPVSGTTIGKFEVKAAASCPAALVGSYAITGKLLAKPQMEAGSKRGSWLLPTAANKSGLKLHGQSTTVAGEVTAETLKGAEIVTLG